MWFFLAWFSKLAVGYGYLFIGSYTNADFYVFSFYPKYNYLFILIIIVLFLQTWTGFLLKFKRNGFKWMLTSALLISVFSFALSRINIVDYHGLNERVSKENIYEKYNLDLPFSDYYQITKRRDRFKQIYMVSPTDRKTSEPIFIIDQEQFSFSSLPSKILEQKYSMPQELRNIIVFQLNIDLNINMEYVELLKEEIAYVNVARLDFAIIPKDHELDIKYYRNHYFSVANPTFYNHQENNLEQYYAIAIEPHDSGSYIVNDSSVAKEELRDYLSDLVLAHPNYHITVSIHKDLTFEEYFFMIQNTKGAILELKDLYSLEIFGSRFDDLHWTNKKEVIQKYPMRIHEVRKGKFPLLEAYERNGPPLPYSKSLPERKLNL